MHKYNSFHQIYFIYELTIANFAIEVMQNIHVNILLFGITKDLVGTQKLSLDIPKSTNVAEFKKILTDRHPELIELNSLAIAVNSEYANDGIILQSNDEVALIPPVSGG